jgi:hypothetical protein
MPEKIRLNLDYGSQATVLSDLVVTVRTIAVILRHILTFPRKAEQGKSCSGKIELRSSGAFHLGQENFDEPVGPKRSGTQYTTLATGA